MKSPAFQFYAADYLADEAVQLMSIEEEGCYIRLMAYCWREGSIPADIEKLSRLCKGASTNVVRLVANCFEVSSTDSSRLVHKRLEQEREKQRDWQLKSSAAGKKSAELKKQKKLKFNQPSNIGSTNLTTLVQPNVNSSFSSSSSLKEKNKKEKSITPAMVAKESLRRCAITSDRVFRQVESQIALDGNSFTEDEADAFIERIAEAWKLYGEAKIRDKLEYSVTAERFFGEGLWRDLAQLPWKSEHKPKAKKVYLNA